MPASASDLPEPPDPSRKSVRVIITSNYIINYRLILEVLTLSHESSEYHRPRRISATVTSLRHSHHLRIKVTVNGGNSTTCRFRGNLNLNSHRVGTLAARNITRDRTQRTTLSLALKLK